MAKAHELAVFCSWASGCGCVYRSRLGTHLVNYCLFALCFLVVIASTRDDAAHGSERRYPIVTLYDVASNRALETRKQLEELIVIEADLPPGQSSASFRGAQKRGVIAAPRSIVSVLLSPDRGATELANFIACFSVQQSRSDWANPANPVERGVKVEIVIVRTFGAGNIF